MVPVRFAGKGLLQPEGSCSARICRFFLRFLRLGASKSIWSTQRCQTTGGGWTKTEFWTLNLNKFRSWSLSSPSIHFPPVAFFYPFLLFAKRKMSRVCDALSGGIFSKMESQRMPRHAMMIMRPWHCESLAQSETTFLVLIPHRNHVSRLCCTKCGHRGQAWLEGRLEGRSVLLQANRLGQWLLWGPICSLTS